MIDDRPSPVIHRLWSKVGESGWESNPPRPATRPATGFEDQEAHRDLTTPACKDNRRQKGLQDNLSQSIKNAALNMRCAAYLPAEPNEDGNKKTTVSISGVFQGGEQTYAPGPGTRWFLVYTNSGLEHQDHPPGIHQHHESIHTRKQAVSSACLLVPDVPIFGESFEFFFYLFHTTRSLVP